ncbi:MAG: acetoin utilization protein AcuC [Pseudomonadota bacterium]
MDDLLQPPGPRLIGNEIYRRSTYGSKHPLAIPRVSLALDLMAALGWVPPGAYLDCEAATPEALLRFHDARYVAALRRAEAQGALSLQDKERYRIGRDGNPIFKEVYSRPATACGASLTAAALVADGGTVFTPAGGTHHGRRDRASGFCYLNDPVLAILALLDQGLEPVFYLDIDAHHGDGVQDAFVDEPRVWTLSLHEAGRWPHRPPAPSGGLEDRGGGQARNLPLPRDFNDSGMEFLLETAILPMIERIEPAALVLQCGVDGLADDPMSRLGLSNQAIWQVVQAVRGLTPRLVMMGGGGYNPYAVARAWAGIWGSLTDQRFPEVLPEEGQALLRDLSWSHSWGRNPPEHWIATLVDPPRRGMVPDEVRRLPQAILS